MIKHSQWSDEYWLLLMQLYLRKPTGLKPLYSRAMVDLSIELHIPPSYIFQRMCILANLETPSIEHLWETYGNNPKRLSRGVKMLREMKGFSKSDTFYEGVELNETFEKDFEPLEDFEELIPVMFVLILDLYFRLTPITMVPDTPEVIELAKLMKIKPTLVAEIMEVFQYCDPYLHRDDIIINPLLFHCQKIWNRFGNENTEKLESFASQLKEYFK